MNKKYLSIVIIVIVVIIASLAYITLIDSELYNDSKKYDFKFFNMNVPLDSDFKETQTNESSFIDQYYYADEKNNISVVVMPKVTDRYSIDNIERNESWKLYENISRELSIYTVDIDGETKYCAMYEDENLYFYIETDNLDKLKTMTNSIEIHGSDVEVRWI